ncbi:GGDEF family protein [Vibrio sinaloensis DSM 21326]|uniref:GGDEF family protein n=1 Tax=Vibrio sinaloensis DSM 21326 TaxID=945550 RepID=E8MAT3_PHOS4|nr:GGDEF domain-containing protein [Vibrio sinaloensis]EGA68763.1 GGDEF family protein [Vibrio sinaloensis DSM 21326]
MFSSLFKKLFLLSTTTMLLTLLIVLSFAKISDEQNQTKAQLDTIIDLQLRVDLLRSQLWVYLQFGDQPSLKQVEFAQAELATQLTAYKAIGGQFDNLQRMNQSLQALLLQEKRLYSKDNGAESGISATRLLHSRYNMIVQNMTEELAHVHKVVVNSSASNLSNMMSYAGAWLMVCSLLVSFIAWLILLRFRSDAESIKTAIVDLAKGKLDAKVNTQSMDSEFKVIAFFFNQMTISLRETTVTKHELEEEVKRQTMQLQKKQEQLIFLSEHDPLTGLYNRRAFDKCLENAIVKANRSGCKLALLFVDLDDFKAVNDTYGHDAGDVILVTVADRLNNAIRQSDFVGRLGGDEFVVCLDLLNDFDILPEKTEQIMQAICEPILFNERELHVSASIGVSHFPDHTKNKEVLISMADEAMYRSKQVCGASCYDGEKMQCQSKSSEVVALASARKQT